MATTAFVDANAIPCQLDCSCTARINSLGTKLSYSTQI